jgi:hypothetical protein
VENPRIICIDRNTNGRKNELFFASEIDLMVTINLNGINDNKNILLFF